MKFGNWDIDKHLQNAMPLFQQSHKSCNDAVLKNFKLVVLDPNTLLIDEGSKPENYYIILSGQIDMYKKSAQH